VGASFSHATTRSNRQVSHLPRSIDEAAGGPNRSLARVTRGPAGRYAARLRLEGFESIAGVDAYAITNGSGSIMRRGALALFAGILLLALLPGSVLAAAGVDQKNEVSNNTLLDTGTEAQTFTVGLAGSMNAVDLWVYTATGTATLAVDIEALDGSGFPNGTSLEHGSTSIGTTANWVHIGLTPLP
jgi:hypothetical protein